MNVDALRAHIAAIWEGRDTRPTRCPKHLTPGFCQPCFDGMDNAGRDDGLSEGDMQVLDRRAANAMTKEWNG